MLPEKPFYILNANRVRNDSMRTIYVDGTADGHFREGIDLELSHWIPNNTPQAFKAGTSTEICYRFLESDNPLPYDLVINNHLDIDGLLSVFVLSYPSIALQHKEVLCAASKTGDFWAWSEGKAFALYQDLSQLYQTLEKERVNLYTAYEKCFALVLNVLNQTDFDHPTQIILEEQKKLIDDAIIQRHEHTKHFVSYFVPKVLTQKNLEGFLGAPHFNQVVSHNYAFWPQVRNRLDLEKIQLLAVESLDGIYYSLWYPGYIWADTAGLWRPSDLIPPKKSEDAHLFSNLKLKEAIKLLNSQETENCFWTMYGKIGLFHNNNPHKFPIVAGTLGSTQSPAPSKVPFNLVLKTLSALYED